jgi:hypothetical protein
MDSLPAHLGFEILLGYHPVLEDYTSHAGADLRAQDGILRQSQIDAQCLFCADGWQGHNCRVSKSGWLCHPLV